ncbi:MAG TPA: hypothetical protein VFQ53_03115 [Kofleriaceae bacterium]|nr:hypothetical protein [Kofleriaceae bacterium]
MIEDLPARYHEYLDRFMTELGDLQVGAFAKYNGRLVKKLSFEEFTPAFLEYTEIADQYQASLERGDTVNDMVLRVLRDQAANLILKPPA